VAAETACLTWSINTGAKGQPGEVRVMVMRTGGSLASGRFEGFEGVGGSLISIL